MSAAEYLGDSVDEFVKSSELQNIICLQEAMMNKFEKTNEMLRTVCELSDQRFSVLSNELTKHTKTLMSLKKDLDDIFKRIKSLKNIFISHFPDQMSKLSVQYAHVSPDYEDVLSNIDTGLQSTAAGSAMETVQEDELLE